MPSILENKLLNDGYTAFSLEEKNRLIQELARKGGVPFNKVTDESILDYHKDMKIYALSSTCEKSILKGFTSSNGHHYRTNRDDQINLIGQKDLLNADEAIQTVYWKTEDAGYIPHEREEWIEKVYLEAFTNKKELLFRYDTLKQAVLKSTTHEEIVSINWEEPLEVVE